MPRRYFHHCLQGGLKTSLDLGDSSLLHCCKGPHSGTLAGVPIVSRVDNRYRVVLFTIRPHHTGSSHALQTLTCPVIRYPDISQGGGWRPSNAATVRGDRQVCQCLSDPSYRCGLRFEKSARPLFGYSIAVQSYWCDIMQLPRLVLTLVLRPICFGSRSSLDRSYMCHDHLI